MKIVHIMGCRPHIVKFVPVTRRDIIIWTGQHYDRELYGDLWREFGLPRVKYELNETDAHEMSIKIQKILRQEKPSCVIVYGDTVTTLAGTLATKIEKFKLAHIEAGVRSEFMERIESCIRIFVDGQADYNFCHNQKAADNLKAEKLKGIVVGDPHYDEYIRHREHHNWTLATIHRAEHTDIKEKLLEILKLLSKQGRVILPAHPRLTRRIAQFNIRVPANIEIVKPVGYKVLNNWYRVAKKVITDSGGVTKEAYFAGCPVQPIDIDEWQEVFDFGDGTAKAKIRDYLKRKLKK